MLWTDEPSSLSGRCVASRVQTVRFSRPGGSRRQMVSLCQIGKQHGHFLLFQLLSLTLPTNSVNRPSTIRTPWPLDNWNSKSKGSCTQEESAVIRCSSSLSSRVRLHEIDSSGSVKCERGAKNTSSRTTLSGWLLFYEHLSAFRSVTPKFCADECPGWWPRQ
jgi:hypothetical protein